MGSDNEQAGAEASIKAPKRVLRSKSPVPGLPRTPPVLAWHEARLKETPGHVLDLLDCDPNSAKALGLPDLLAAADLIQDGLKRMRALVGLARMLPVADADPIVRHAISVAQSLPPDKPTDRNKGMGLPFLSHLLGGPPSPEDWNVIVDGVQRARALALVAPLRNDVGRDGLLQEIIEAVDAIVFDDLAKPQMLVDLLQVLPEAEKLRLLDRITALVNALPYRAFRAGLMLKAADQLPEPARMTALQMGIAFALDPEDVKEDHESWCVLLFLESAVQMASTERTMLFDEAAKAGRSIVDPKRRAIALLVIANLCETSAVATLFDESVVALADVPRDEFPNWAQRTIRSWTHEGLVVPWLFLSAAMTRRVGRDLAAACAFAYFSVGEAGGRRKRHEGHALRDGGKPTV